MPDHAREQAEKELGRLEKMGEQSAESSVIRTYLDWLIAVPWSKQSEERLDPRTRGRCWTPTTPGLEDVKKRIVEYIAVKKLRQERGIDRGQALGRDPDADRASGHRQDVDRRVDRARHRPRVRADVAGRRP